MSLKSAKKIGKNRGLMAIVKADGYGHGSEKVSQAALNAGADCLGVALPEEAKSLRNAGIDAPILVMSLIQPEEAYKVIDSAAEQALCTLELAEALDQEAEKTSLEVNIHVKIDTGMGDLIREIQDAGIKISKKHMANSAGVLDLPESYYDLVRPGIMIYGLYPSEEVNRSIELRPAMTLKTKIAFLKTTPPDTPISYGRTFHTTRATKVASLPVGYGDGYSRLLSNRASVCVRERRAPLIGRVCMDMCMADVSGIEDVQIGDEVVLFGEEPSVNEIAELIGTINYEVVCAIGKRVPRTYVEE
jgi:alanine racemase